MLQLWSAVLAGKAQGRRKIEDRKALRVAYR
jgi:hypothetical protein